MGFALKKILHALFLGATQYFRNPANGTANSTTVVSG
jgi:hypothetical protein